jgi:hypothetical protein
MQRKKARGWHVSAAPINLILDVPFHTHGLLGLQGRPVNPVQIPDAADHARFELFYCIYIYEDCPATAVIENVASRTYSG